MTPSEAVEEEEGDLIPTHCVVAAQEFVRIEMEAQVQAGSPASSGAQESKEASGPRAASVSSKRPSDADVARLFHAQGGGPFPGMGTTPCNNDGSINIAANHARIAAIREKITASTVGTGRHLRYMDTLISSDPPEELRIHHLVLQGMSREGALALVAEEALSPKQKVQETLFQKARNARTTLPVSAWPLAQAWPQWEKRMKGHPSNLAVSLLIDRFAHGANVAYYGPRSAGLRESPSRGSAATRAVVRKECKELQSLHKIVSSNAWKSPPFVSSFVHSVTAIPKKIDGEFVSGKHRVIHNPALVNKFQRLLWCPTMKFTSLTDAVFRARKGALISKEDDTKAFFSIPLRPADQHLFGLNLGEDGYGYFNCLTMGNGSSPALYGTKADMFMWILRHHVRAMKDPPSEPGVAETVGANYVDDFMFVHALEALTAQVGDARGLDTPLAVANATMAEIRAIAKELKFEFADNKRQDPATISTLLGVVFDTIKGTLSISDARRQALRRQLQALSSSTQVLKKTCEELLGRLLFVNQVAPCIRPFLCRLTTAMVSATWAVVHKHKKQWHEVSNTEVYVPITPLLKEDFQALLEYLRTWNCTELILSDSWTPMSAYYCGATAGGDANLQGYGGVFEGYWFADTWSDADRAAAQRVERLSITYLEALTQLRLSRSSASTQLCAFKSSAKRPQLFAHGAAGSLAEKCQAVRQSS